MFKSVAEGLAEVVVQLFRQVLEKLLRRQDAFALTSLLESHPGSQRRSKYFLGRASRTKNLECQRRHRLNR